MAESPHPAATYHLPSFITPPGETDVLMVAMAVFLAVAVLAFGILFLRLHTLPERMAHRTHKIQFEIVAVLGLIALFTHMHIFWIAGLMLALIELPDFGTALTRIANSTEKIADTRTAERELSPPDAAAGGPPEIIARAEQRDNASARAPTKPEPAAAGQKELTHA